MHACFNSSSNTQGPNKKTENTPLGYKVRSSQSLITAEKAFVNTQQKCRHNYIDSQCHVE